MTAVSYCVNEKVKMSTDEQCAWSVEAVEVHEESAAACVVRGHDLQQGQTCTEAVKTTFIGSHDFS